MTTGEAVRNAWMSGRVVPAFNISYLPMVEPVIRAVVLEDCFALIEVARLEWEKFEAGSPADVLKEFRKCTVPGYVALHLDHVPVIDEDGNRVDYLSIIRQAISLGYESVMVDGSRLPLSDNIRSTREIVELAHAGGIPCEAELGAVLGHEDGPLPPYEDLFASGRGFTDAQEAARFVHETGCDWLSVAAGNVHGAISLAFRDRKKVQSRLDVEHIRRLRSSAGVPLVLHGGSGIRREDLLAAVSAGIAKVNVRTEIRQAYESGLMQGGIPAGQRSVLERTRRLLREFLSISGTRRLVTAGTEEKSGGTSDEPSRN